MTVIRGKYILRGDIWFDDKPENLPALDVLYYYFQETLPPSTNFEFDEEYTLLLDLTQDRDKLWKRLHRNSRYEINRAIKSDPFVYDFFDRVDSNLLDEFFELHEQFTLFQGLSKLRKDRLESYADAGELNLSRVKLIDDKSLTWHVYSHSQNRVFLLHSASVRDNESTSNNRLISRANRYHHWQDILKFKDLGISLYDFGGWFANTQEPKLININKFKEEFGGELVKNFNWRQGLTLKGKLFLRLRKLLIRQQIN